jgi:hypothetical protein
MRRTDPNRSTLSTLKITPWASPLDIIELQPSHQRMSDDRAGRRPARHHPQQAISSG